MKAITGEEITIKAAVGRFAFGYTGPQAWVVVIKDTRSICARAGSMSEAHRLATRFYNEERDQ